MLNNLISFFKSFVYAGNGLLYAVKTQRNFRFHLAAAVWVTLLSLFYDLSRAEYAVLFLTYGTVIALEAVNTAIEKAVDLCTKEKKPIAAAAKDCAACAVLIAAIFSVAVAVCLFWDKTVFWKIAEYFGGNPFCGIAVIIFALLTFIFIFKGK